MTDVDKVIKGLKFLHDVKDWSATESEQDKRARRNITDAAISLLKAQEVNGWISVKNKKPKSMANKVLVWLEHEELAGYIGFGHYEKYKGVEMWYDLEHNEQFAKRGYTVTYWMPLPELPKEEDDDKQEGC